MNSTEFESHILNLITKYETDKDAAKEYDDLSIEDIEKKIYFSAEFIQKLELMSDNHHAITLLGIHYMSPGYETKALELFQKADKLAKSKKSVAVKALYMMMTMYGQGLGVKKDFEKFFELTKELADLEVPLCMFNLALAYYNGENGITINYKKAFELITKVLRKNQNKSAEAMLLAGKMHANGHGTKENLETAFYIANELFKKMYNAMDIIDILLLKKFRNGDTSVYTDVFKYWYARSLTSNIEAVYMVAACYSHGLGVEINQKLAIKYAESQPDDASCNALLFAIYFKSDPTNPKKYLEYGDKTIELAKLNKPGFPIIKTLLLRFVCIKLISIYYDGNKENEPNYKKAFKVAKFANKHCNIVQISSVLAEMYYLGRGTSINNIEGFKHADYAYKNGNEYSGTFVAISLITGEGVKQNTPKGFKILEELIKKGNNMAKLNYDHYKKIYKIK